MIVSSAPGRCGVVGNPTDMYGGSVVSCSTAERARCTLAESPALTLCAGGEVEEIRTTDDLRLSRGRLDIGKAVLTYFGLGPENFRFMLSVSSDVPECAGLAGSTAIVVAVLGVMVLTRCSSSLGACRPQTAGSTSPIPITT